MGMLLRAVNRYEGPDGTMLHVRQRENIAPIVAGEPFQFTHRLENEGVMAEGRIHRNWFKATRIQEVPGGYHIYCELDPSFFPTIAPRVPPENPDFE